MNQISSIEMFIILGPCQIRLIIINKKRQFIKKQINNHTSKSGTVNTSLTTEDLDFHSSA